MKNVIVFDILNLNELVIFWGLSFLQLFTPIAANVKANIYTPSPQLAN